MDGYNFGPEWFWRFVFILAGLGALAVLVGIVWGIVWLVTHIRFV